MELLRRISFFGIARHRIMVLLFVLPALFLPPSPGHAQQGKPGEAAIQTFIALYQDTHPANRVASMLLSVGMVDHAELTAALRKRLPTAPPGERELVLYTLAALSYTSLTQTSTNPADIEAWLDAFPSEYATYKIMSGAEEVLAAGVWNTQITDFLSVLACDPLYRDKARTALAQDSEFRSAVLDAYGRPRIGNPDIYRACLDEEYTPTRAITPVPADTGDPYTFDWGDATYVGERLAKLLDDNDPTTRVAALFALRNAIFDSSVYMQQLEEYKGKAHDPGERVLIDLLYDFPGDYAGKQLEEQLCRDFPKTPEGIEHFFELESTVYKRDHIPLLSGVYYPNSLGCLDEKGVPLSFHILQSGKKYMTDVEYQYYLEVLARNAINGGPTDEYRSRYRHALRVGPPEFQAFVVEYVRKAMNAVEKKTNGGNAEEAYMTARREAYLQAMRETLSEMSGSAAEGTPPKKQQ